MTAVELGSFTAAAARMSLSKSAVAKNVARLEERIGTRLLDRTTRRLGLTVDGHAYFETCLRVLSELENAEALLCARQTIASGVLRVSLPASFGPRWAIPMLLEILRDFPQVSLDVTFTDRYVDLIDEGIDLAIRIGDLEDSASLIARKIGDQHSIVCASPEYLDRRGRLQGPEEIGAHDCIGEARAGRILPWYLKGSDGKTTKLAIKPRHVVTDGDGMLGAAISGGGLAYLPTWLVSADLRAGRLEAVLASARVNDRPIHLVWPRMRDVLPKVRVIVDEIARRTSGSPPWADLDG